MLRLCRTCWMVAWKWNESQWSECRASFNPSKTLTVASLKVVSDSISECLFCKNFLGGDAPRPPRRLVLRTMPVCFTHQDTIRPCKCDFRNGQPNLVLIGHSVPAIIFRYIVNFNNSTRVWNNPHCSVRVFWSVVYILYLSYPNRLYNIGTCIMILTASTMFAANSIGI